MSADATRAEPARRRPRRDPNPKRRREILAAAAELLVERGYHGTSMRAIARAADIDTASLYHYFSSKDELVYELVSHMYAERLREAEEADAEAPTAERLRRFALRHFHGLAERFEVVAIAYRNDTHLLPPRRHKLHADRERYVAAFRALIEEGLARGDVVAGVDAELAARGLLGMAFVMCEAVARSGTAERSAAGETYAGMVVRSLVRPERLASC